MAGALMGSDKSTTELPSWVTDASQKNIKRADDVAGLGYVPYVGPDVAALSSGEMASHRNNAKAAGAFGLRRGNPMQDLPPAQDFGGVQAYSAFPMYAAALEEMKTRYPDKYAFLMGQLMAQRGGGMPQEMPQEQQPPMLNTDWGVYEQRRF